MSSDEILRASQAMENLAKMVLERRNAATIDEKMRRLDELINMILQINDCHAKVDTEKLKRSLLRQSVEIVEKNHQKYALIPVMPVQRREPARRRQSKLQCSFCQEVGHTRAHCEKRLHP
ncbi:YER137C [Zygosaccharomyces parabailii]|nr:YER137C [Zygosaccharomyces parabailii]CDH10866.1 uncharacterized protein ZBAI_02652 [Zygosaccharomyces bailii ISA1307]